MKYDYTEDLAVRLGRLTVEEKDEQISVTTRNILAFSISKRASDTVRITIDGQQLSRISGPHKEEHSFVKDGKVWQVCHLLKSLLSTLSILIVSLGASRSRLVLRSAHRKGTQYPLFSITHNFCDPEQNRRPHTPCRPQDRPRPGCLPQARCSYPGRG